MNEMDIVCFLDAARSHSFSLTAKELSISQQLVSRHIRNIENELGFPLFARSYSSTVLTKRGKQLYDWLVETDAGLSWAKCEFRTREDPILHVAFDEWTGPITRVMRSLDEYCDRRWVPIVHSLRSIETQLTARITDMAFLPEPMARQLSAQTGICSTPPLLSIPLFVVCAAPFGHFEDDYKREPPKGFYYRTEMGDSMNSFLGDVNIGYFARFSTLAGSESLCPNWDSVIAQCVCGRGYTIASGEREEIRQSPLLLRRELGKSVNICAVWHHDAKKLEHIRRFVDWMMQGGTKQ